MESLALMVRVVQYAWIKLASELAGHPFRAKELCSYTKLYKNCLAVAEFCLEKKITVCEYMLAIHALYGASWINRTFDQPYLPFQIAVSANSLAKAHEIFLDEAKAAPDLKTELENYLFLLNDIPPKVAIELVRNGFCGLNTKLHELLIERLAHKRVGSD